MRHVSASSTVPTPSNTSAPASFFDASSSACSAPGVVIEKTRHTVDHGGFTWEVDVFEGKYHGLVVAEVEMNDENADPDLPSWLGREVTGDKRFSNQSLAMDCPSGDLSDALQN